MASPRLAITPEQLEAAIAAADADVRDRLLIFDGGPTLMSWAQAHHHHGTEPYIGCVFCRDSFVLLPDRDEDDLGPFDGDELVKWAETYGHPDGWAKRAQAAHTRAERAEAALARARGQS